MQPINYQIDVANPIQTAMQGFAQGFNISTAMEEREAAAQARAMKEAQFAAQQAAAIRRQQALSQFYAKPQPTAADYAQILAAAPDLKDQLKQGWDALSTERKQADFAFGSQAYAAALAGKPEIAANMFRERATALKNSGGNAQEVGAHEAIAQLIEREPDLAARSIAMKLASVDPDKFAETVTKLGGEARAEAKAPAELRQAEAAATTAETTARFAESKALRDLEEQGYRIESLKIEPEFKRQTMRIQAMQAAIARETNALKRTELQIKMDDAQRERDSKLRATVAEADAATGNIDNMLNTMARIKANPNLNDVIGGIEGRLPAISDASVDAIAMIETLGSQAFLSQIPNIKGMGQLSNAEGEKLQAALQNFTRKQSEKQFRENLAEANRLLTKARSNIERRLGVPASRPDVPAAGQPAASGAGGGGASFDAAPARVSSDAEYAALPSGATFIAPDGTTRRKP